MKNKIIDTLAFILLLWVAVAANNAMSLTAGQGLDDCEVLQEWDKAGYTEELPTKLANRAVRCANMLGIFRSMNDNGLLSVKFCLPTAVTNRVLVRSVVSVGKFIEEKDPEVMEGDVEFLYYATMLTLFACENPSHKSEAKT